MSNTNKPTLEAPYIISGNDVYLSAVPSNVSYTHVNNNIHEFNGTPYLDGSHWDGDDRVNVEYDHTDNKLYEQTIREPINYKGRYNQYHPNDFMFSSNISVMFQLNGSTLMVMLKNGGGSYDSLSTVLHGGTKAIDNVTFAARGDRAISGFAVDNMDADSTHHDLIAKVLDVMDEVLPHYPSSPERGGNWTSHMGVELSTVSASFTGRESGAIGTVYPNHATVAAYNGISNDEIRYLLTAVGDTRGTRYEHITNITTG